MAKAPEPKAAPAEKSLYRLKSAYWDGRIRHEVGDTLRFVPGTQPRTAELISEQSLPEMEAPVNPGADNEDDDE
jgi:hypothetical protein